MEDESNNSEMETAFGDEQAISVISRYLDDVPEDSVEQPEEHVEEPTTEADEAEDVETPEEQFFDFDGEQISLTDLRNGYLRQQDYTRKTQEIAEQRRVYQEGQFDRNQIRGEAIQALEALKQNVAMQFQLMEQPDFNFLAENDPAEFVRQKHIWESREAAVRQMHEAETYLKNQMAEYEAQQHQAALQESHQRFLTKYPEMQDANKSSEALSEITGYLLETGFTKEEIQSVNDFRIIDILYQNIQMKKTQKAVPDVVAKMEKKPALSMKENSKKASQSSYDVNREKFNKTQSKNDALALIKGLL